jgi:hypothetical protein
MTILWTVWLSTVLIASGVVYFGHRRSGYSHVRHTISELGESGSPSSQIVSLGVFLPVGVGCLLVARWSADRLKGSELSEGLSTLALSIAIGYIVGAIFRCDPGCPLAGTARGRGAALRRAGNRSAAGNASGCGLTRTGRDGACELNAPRVSSRLT